MGIWGFWAPRGPQGPSLGLRAKFGLFSDQGGLANDVSKAKNLVQIFSGENACFSQSRPFNHTFFKIDKIMPGIKANIFHYHSTTATDKLTI